MMKTPAQMVQLFRTVGARKARLPAGRCLLLAFMAGMMIGLAGVGSAVAQAAAGNGSLARLAGAAVFPAGLMLVVGCGAELFTGNSLMVIALAERDISPGGMLRNWGLVYLGNLAGAACMAVVCRAADLGNLMNGALGTFFVSAAESKAALGFLPALSRGVLCNVLVCAAVMMAAGAENGADKCAVIFFPVMLFVLCGFEHCVANMFSLPMGLLCGAGQAAGMAKNLLSVTLGNVLGGVGFALICRAGHGKTE